MNIILDIKSCICEFDEDVWIKMVICDVGFKEYAYTKDGVNQFIKLFYREDYGKRYLFDKLHSINDLPTIIKYNGDNFWYYNDKLHRDNDLPALIYANGDKYWYYNEKGHRENDLPAVILCDGTKIWYRDGKRHRENNLPAFIYGSMVS